MDVALLEVVIVELCSASDVVASEIYDVGGEELTSPEVLEVEVVARDLNLESGVVHEH